MKNETWPAGLMIIGFGAALVCLALLFFANFSSSVNVVLTIGESLGVGIGSVGIGGQITRSRRHS